MGKWGCGNGRCLIGVLYNIEMMDAAKNSFRAFMAF